MPDLITTVIKDADAPFDNADSDADIILRSSDNVDFHVHRLILSKASPMFATMFSLPRTSQASSADETKNGVPLVRMVEDARTLLLLLRFCYPVPRLALVDPADVRILCAVARKFDAAVVEAAAEGELSAMLAHGADPERVYALAWSMGLRNVVRDAARRTLRQPLLTGPCWEEFADVSGVALHRLLEYQRSCILAAQLLTTDFMWMELAAIPKPIDAVCPHRCPTHKLPKIRDRGHVDVKKWWCEYLAHMRDAFAANLVEWRTASARGTLLAVQKAMECQGCRNVCNDHKTSIVDVMEHFNRRFAEEVEARVSEVQLVTPF
ncbi:hypothetical protein FA95DRAFT_1602896 [Auriscalpium vulgare]|uniref:Uncharacterized protein n=1 Tax=Auriscalpium vulgare TaxID=40419 RepID=A0ACB8S4L3_9AGAM|nr:hypothetical protein FA95DRAFT_1602896 [Auriscalpium vulgare]